MILDLYENLEKYKVLHPSFEKVFNYLRSLNINNLPIGRIEVDEDFYLNVEQVELRNPRIANLEAHDSYIDIQIPILNSEFVGYKARKKCSLIKELHLKKDFILYKDRFDFSFLLSVGSFAIFFPQDAHAPLIGKGITKKIVVKVKL